MTSDAILAELRGLRGAPDGLRERVLALPEPQPRFAWTLPRVDVRRSLLVLAPAVVALGVGAAALHGMLAGGSRTSRPLAISTEQRGARAAGGGHFGMAKVPGAKALLAPQLSALPPSTSRLNRYNAWLRVRVDDDQLAGDAACLAEKPRGVVRLEVAVEVTAEHPVERLVRKRERLHEALAKLDVVGAGLGDMAASAVEHRRRHIEPDDAPVRSDGARREERVDAGSAADVEDPFAVNESSVAHRMIHAEGEGHGARRQHRQLLGCVQHRGHGPAPLRFFIGGADDRARVGVREVRHRSLRGRLA